MTEATDTRRGASALSSAFTSWHSRAAGLLYADLLAVLTAAMLPWSTTAVLILIGLWFLSLIPLISTPDARASVRVVSHPISWLPLAIFALALIGTLWGDAPWRERILGIGPVIKLLAIPFFLHYFHRTKRGAWVFIAFLASCTVLMGLSWIELFDPQLKITATKNAGVPVKNYIDQSQEFALCMVALTPFVITLYKQHRYWAAVACAALALGFLANMAFVASARAALFYVPVLLSVFAFTHLGRRGSALLFAGLVLAATLILLTSPYLQKRIADVSVEYHEYQQNIPASTGRRLEYWKKSLGFFAQAPLFGNGTGSIQYLFEREAVGQIGLGAEITKNPHNQTLSVAVQWGLTGVVALYAMWLAHLLLFRGQGLANWIGLLVVVQNIVSSLFNSHLFDFVEGWIYVLGVGVAGGMSLKARRRSLQASRVGGPPPS
jgi:O-antigen ligase